MPVLRVSQPQDTEAGNFLAHLYYFSRAMELFTSAERGGYPHDGGSHSLVFYLNDQFTADDVKAWLGILVSTYGLKYGCAEFVADVRQKLDTLLAGLNPRKHPFYD